MVPAGSRRDYDIAALERQLERTEDADADAHPIYNNLGLAYTKEGNYRKALYYHRREKEACKRLASTSRDKPERLIDLAIAYRLAGNATLHVDKLAVDNGAKVTDDRLAILRQAHVQHGKALKVALEAAQGGAAADFELQTATAAMAQSAISIALETQVADDFRTASELAGKAAVRAENLSDKEAGGKKVRGAMTLAAAVNLGLALSGLGDKQRAKTLFQAAAVKARKAGATETIVQCVANLAQEAQDECDWDLCLDYADEWVLLSKKLRDKPEEADAQRMRGRTLVLLRQFDAARTAFERAEIYGRDERAREDARTSREWVEKEIDAQKDLGVALAAAVAECEKALSAEDPIAEARAKLDAAEASFSLGMFSVAIDHFGRYFELVDEYACSTGVTGIGQRRHCMSVTSMAESMHHEKRFTEAVQWAERELQVCEVDDKAAQASAYCNIGNYNDDLGKYEAAKENLRKSIVLATESGDQSILEKAKNNLSIVLENEAEKNTETIPQAVAAADTAVAGSDDVVVGSQNSVELVEDFRAVGMNNAGQQFESADVPVSPTRMPANGGEREESICISSGSAGGFVGASRVRSGATSNAQGGMNSVPPVRNSSSRAASHTRVTGTASASVADRSFAGKRRIIDVADIYRRRCEAVSQRPGVGELEVRRVILQRLQPLSAKVVACADSDVLEVDMSLCFLHDGEFRPLVEALAELPVHAPLLHLNCSLNPIITSDSVRWLASSANGPPRPLESLVALDLSGAGLTSSCLGPLARALTANGVLPCLANLFLGKNAIGNVDNVTANAVGLLLMQETRLKHLDMSLNLLSHTFLPQLADAVELLAKQKPAGTTTSILSFDLRLNNRRNPTALLELSPEGFSSPEEPVQCITRILEAVPSLSTLDVRASGAAWPVRQSLCQLQSGLNPDDNLLSLVPRDEPDKNIIVVSPGVDDVEALR